MTSARQDSTLFVGGPRDGEVLDALDAPVVNLEIDGFVHRYIRTNVSRVHEGRPYLVYNYDGMIDPNGAQDGAEHADLRAGPAPGAAHLDGDATS